jgi:uncharacterized tellurite resistance protein B-like protein
MGLFDKLTGQREIALTPQGGLLLAAITMVGADGHVDDDELAVIRRLDGSGATIAWDAAVKTYRLKSVRECIGLATSAMNREQRLVTMANLVDIAMADGGLAGAEKDLLEAFVEAFGVSQEDVARIVDVISIKNNKSIFE